MALIYRPNGQPSFEDIIVTLESGDGLTRVADTGKVAINPAEENGNLANILTKLIAAPATEAKQDSIIAALAATWSVRGTDNVVNGSWNAAKAFVIGSDTVHLSALAVTLGTIVGLTSLDWYLSWDAAGLEPITDRQSWTLATDMGLDRAGTARIAVAKIDLDIERPTGIGVANTVYLHTYGTAGTAVGVFTISGTK